MSGPPFRTIIEVVIDTDFRPTDAELETLAKVASDATLAIGTRVRPSGEHRDPGWSQSDVATGLTWLAGARARSIDCPLRVYRMTRYRAEGPGAPNGNRQTCEVVAAKSAVEAARLFGCSRGEWKHSGSITAQADAIAAAMQEPGVVRWRPLDARPGTVHGRWRK